MPTYLRLILILGEIIGLLIFSFIRCRQNFKAYKEDKYNKGNRNNLKVLITYYSICNIIVLFVFIFTFPSYFFLSYNKIILLTIVGVTSILPYIFLKKYEEHMGISVVLFLLFCTGMSVTAVFTIFSFCHPEELISFKTCIKEEKNIEVINLESKIGHYIDNYGEDNNYIFSTRIVMVIGIS